MLNSATEIIFKYLPMRISKAINGLPPQCIESLTEIRLRANMPLSLTAEGKNMFITQNGSACRINRGICATKEELAECLRRLTQGSLYSYEEYIAQGYIPLAEGGRAGVCGTAVLKNGNIAGFSDISSVNLRLHRFLPDIALPLAEHYQKHGVAGTLVCAPPGLGKTSFLRSIAYLLSVGRVIDPLRIALADERQELAAALPKNGIIDYVANAPKADAITLLTRTMAPQIIICDEISPSECLSVLESQNTGVTFIASAHCAHPKQLLKRGRMGLMLESGIFPLCVILGYNQGYTCQIAPTRSLL